MATKAKSFRKVDKGIEKAKSLNKERSFGSALHLLLYIALISVDVEKCVIKQNSRPESAAS